MRKFTGPLAFFLLLATACSPRDFLTRRLAADLIAGSDTFQMPQQFWLRTGAVSNKDYTSPEYLVLQRHGWITATNVACPANITPPPCWDVILTPLGIDTIRNWVPTSVGKSHYFSVPVGRRELLEITGITKNGNTADVEFRWRWVALNELGSGLYAPNMDYKSTVGFIHYDDGWRIIEGSAPKSSQGVDEALKNATPAP
jgi:hypothetical protein